MRTSAFDYDLPDRRIAQRPARSRDGARMLVVGREKISHDWVRNWPLALVPGALVIVNDTKVLRARLWAHREPSGGRVEVLLLAPLEDEEEADDTEVWAAMLRGNRPLADGTPLRVGDAEILVEGRLDPRTFRVRIASPGGVFALLETHGHVPLPPYIKRPDEVEDTERYQTIFAEHGGSVAAPTAGLHLTPSMLEALGAREVSLGAVTLHVGAGTFLPVTADDLDDHVMHREFVDVGSDLVRQIARVKELGKPVVAVGTTVVRALEAAATFGGGSIGPFRGMTDLLIQPGFRFQVVDSLLTNFHAPRSTLLALVHAFIGSDAARRAYRAALEHEYRFLSYGDAMWLPERASIAQVLAEAGSES